MKQPILYTSPDGDSFYVDPDDHVLLAILKDQDNGITAEQAKARDQAIAKVRWQQAANSLASQLYAARRQKHLTQAQLAERAGISQPALANIEAGRTNPTLKTLQKLAEVLEARLSLLQKPE